MWIADKPLYPGTLTAGLRQRACRIELFGAHGVVDGEWSCPMSLNSTAGRCCGDRRVQQERFKADIGDVGVSWR